MNYNVWSPAREPTVSFGTPKESKQTLLASAVDRALAGSWELGAGRVVSLIPRERGVLEISQGRVWLALGARPGKDEGTEDIVLVQGQSLAIEPGQRVVMESWNLRGSAPGAVGFSWTPARVALISNPVVDWERGVAQPLRELVCALVQAGRAVGTAMTVTLGASGRLAAGLSQFALHRITHQGACGRA